MRDQPDSNVFSPVFLDVLNSTDRSGYTVYEATYAGPWHVVERQGGFAVMQEAAGTKGKYDAIFVERETALLAAAVYPVLGRQQPFYAVNQAPDGKGSEIFTVWDGNPVRAGWLRFDHPELLDAVHVAEYLLRSPQALALLLEAGGYEPEPRPPDLPLFGDVRLSPS